jgi:ParB-like chromosome segregation protein Spo0J
LQGFQQLLDIPGYDVAALVEKSGKSASHIYARLSLLQLIREVAEAFTQERITASHTAIVENKRLGHTLALIKAQQDSHFEVKIKTNSEKGEYQKRGRQIYGPDYVPKIPTKPDRKT